MIGSNYKAIVRVGEHAVKMPQLTKDRRDVLFIDERDAYWRRDLLIGQYKKIWWEFIPYHTKVYQDATLYDQDDILISLNKEDSDYIYRTYKEEMRRRNDGVFMKNGDDIIWLTGDIWFILMYCKTKRPDKKDFFDFRMFQLEDSYLCNHIENNSLIGGLIESKPKKTGITNLRWLYLLNRATKTKNSNYGAMNIDQDKCAKTFRDHFMYAYNGLPSVWKAQIKSKSETDGRIVFGKQYGNSKKSRLMHNDAADELNTTVMCVPTMSHAFDVDVFDINWYDEFPKYKTDFGDIYRSNNSGTSIQDQMVGKIWLTSYTPDESGPSFFSGKELYFNSELRTITERSNGQTKSKLICHHIPAYASWGTSFNKLGQCNEVDAMRKIQFGRDQFKDRPRELQAEIRKYANDKKEAWATGGGGSVFDNVRLSELLVDLEEEQRSAIETPYKEGKLEWRNKVWEIGLKNKRPKGVFDIVEFVPLTNQEMLAGEKGRLRIYNEIPRHLQNAALKNGKDEWGCLIPPSVFNYVYGADPTQYAANSEVIEGSKNAYTIKSRADDRLDSIHKGVASNRFDIIYFGRPELPHEAYEDLVKLIIYTGSLGIVEANVPTMATSLLEEGLGGFMLVRNDEGIITQWKRHMGLAHETEKTYHLIRTTSNSADAKLLLEQFVASWKSYIQKPMQGEKDYGKTLKDERIVNQLMNISLDKAGATRLFDLFMATGYAFLADAIYSALLLIDDEADYSKVNVQSVLRALEA
jgi:hypothetical protein